MPVPPKLCHAVRESLEADREEHARCDEPDRDDSVEPIVIRGERHGGEGHRQMTEHAPTPPTAAHGNRGNREERCPADVQRRHGRKLVRTGVAEGRVHRLAIADAGVDHVQIGDEARRCDRDQLHEQTAEREECQRRSPERISIAVTEVQPN